MNTNPIISSADVQSLGQFLGRSNDHLEIPRYQRAFSWKKQQVRDFLEDISDHDFSPDKEGWYLGSFYTGQLKNNKKEILDGQQRLTTFFIFIKELMLYANEFLDENDRTQAKIFKEVLIVFILDDKDNPKLILDEENKVCFNDYLIEQNASAAVFNPSLGSQKLLNNALIEIRNELKNVIIKQDLNKFDHLIKYIKNSIFVLEIMLKKSSGFNELFEGLNNRGLSLSSSDLFKNTYLLYEKDEDKRKKFDLKWFTIQKKMYRIDKSFEDDVMYYMHLSRGKDHSNKSVVNILKDEIKSHKDEDITNFLHRRFKEVERSSNAIKSIYGDKKYDVLGDNFFEFYFDENQRTDSKLQKKSKYVAYMVYMTWKNIKQFSIVFYALIRKFNFKNDEGRFTKLLRELSIATRYYLIMHLKKEGANKLRIQAARIADYISSDLYSCDDKSSIANQKDIKRKVEYIKENNINDESQFVLDNKFSALFLLFIQMSKSSEQFLDGRGNFSKRVSLEHLAPSSWEKYWSDLKLTDKEWKIINEKYFVSNKKGFLTRKYNN